MNRPEFAAAIREKYMLNESIDTGQRFEVYDALLPDSFQLTLTGEIERNEP
jgi:hypothetical protein